MKTMKSVRRALAILCVAIIASFALAGSAFAATVHGTDFHGSGSALEAGEIDVLEVDGSAGETVFLTVKARGAELAKNLPYTIGATAAQDDKTTWAGVATLDISKLDLNALDGTYTVEAFANRAGSELLYSGALYGVYADLPDGTAKLIGTRTVNAAEATARDFNAPETLYVDGHTYRLVGAAQGDTAQHYAYQEYDESTTIDGVVKYLDAKGATVATTKIPGLAYGETRTVTVPSVVTGDDGNMYRTVYFKNSLTAENPGRTSFSIYCTQMSASDKTLAGFYVATIQMVDQTGRVIASDSVDVTGEFVYTAPLTIYKSEVDAATGEAVVVTYEITQTPVIRLSAANDGVLNRTRTVQLVYEAQPLDANEANVTFNLIDGSKRINDKDRLLGTESAVATVDSPTVVPQSEVKVDGTSYYLVGEPADYAFTLRTGMIPSVDAYYVPEGYVAPGAYDVTVNYVNFLTDTVVESHTYKSDANENSRIAIDVPETFKSGDVEYVKLAGQDAAIQHSYYSGISAYTVYYRDVNDTLTSGTVINTIRVVYQDGTTTGGETEGAEGAAGTAGGAAAGATGATADAVAAAIADGAQALQLNAGRTYNVFDGGDNNATMTNESGVNSNTERIEDSETPLASGFDRGASSSAASSFASMNQILIPLAIAVAVAIIAIVAIRIIRRKNDRDEA